MSSVSGQSVRPGSARVQLPRNPSESSRRWVRAKGQVQPASLWGQPWTGRASGPYRPHLVVVVGGVSNPRGKGLRVAGADPDHPFL